MKDKSENYKEVLNRLKIIEKIVFKKQKNPSEVFLDNQEFIRVMNISKRLAQTWRDNGIIGFSSVGNKIYYKMSDIHSMLDKHYKESI